MSSMSTVIKRVSIRVPANGHSDPESASVAGTSSDTRTTHTTAPDVDEDSNEPCSPFTPMSRRASTPSQIKGRLESGLRAVKQLGRSITPSRRSGRETAQVASPPRRPSYSPPPADKKEEETQPPWQDVRENQGVKAQMQELTAEVDRFVQPAMHERLEALRDAVASETWALAEEEFKQQRREAQKELELGRELQEQARQMQASCVQEMRERSERTGSRRSSIHVCKLPSDSPHLRHLDSATKRLVEMLVRDTMEDLVDKCVSGVPNDLTVALRAGIASDSGSGLANTFPHMQIEDLEEKVQSLNKNREALQSQVAAYCRAAQAKDEECKGLEAKLAMESGQVKSLQSQLTWIQKHLQELSTSSQEVRRELELKLAKKSNLSKDLLAQLAEAQVEAQEARAASKELHSRLEAMQEAAANCAESATTHTPSTSDTPSISGSEVSRAPSSCASAGYEWGAGATGPRLLRMAKQMHRQLESNNNSVNSSHGFIAQDLIAVLRMLASQLDRRACASTSLEVLSQRIGSSRRESDALWESWTSLWTAVAELSGGETAGTGRLQDAVVVARAGLSQLVCAFEENVSKDSGSEGEQEGGQGTPAAFEAACEPGHSQSPVRKQKWSTRPNR